MPARVRVSSENFSATLQQVGGYIIKAVNDDMDLAMNVVLLEAKALVPFEKGNMEDAIKIQKGDRRRSWTVYVDPSMPDDTGKYTVGTYLTFLHESVYKLGKGSLEKAAANGKQVGNKFLTRAFNEYINDAFVAHLQDVVDTAVERINAGRAR